jgi:hypothetical protein
MEVKEMLDRLTPETEVLPDWDRVVRESRPSRGRWAAPRLAVVGAVLGLAAILTVAPWRSGEKVGVLDHALAAVGHGPVLHLALQEEWGGTVVDLKTGERAPLRGRRELWFDPSRGLHERLMLGPSVEEDFLQEPEAGRGSLAARYGAIATGYRAALADGSAQIEGPGKIDGASVYWIKYGTNRFPDVPNARAHLFAYEVAVSQDSYEPVYYRQSRDGKAEPTTGARVDTLEFLAAGEGNFEPSDAPRQAAGQYSSSALPGERITRAEASRRIGGRPVWLGESFAGLSLSQFGSYELRTGRTNSGHWAEVVRGVTASYDSENGLEAGPNRSHVLLREADRLHPSLRIGVGNYVPPVGSVYIWDGRHGFLQRDGAYVAIDASSEALVLSAARALRPLNAGSGAGG